MFDEISEKYCLTPNHIAKLLEKTEKQLLDDLNSGTMLSATLKQLLNTPSQLLNLLKNGEDKIPTNVYLKSKKLLEEELYSTLSEIYTGYAFLKRVQSNELGFRNGVANKAGSFLLIPKTCINFFPEVNADVLNASSTISLTIKPENETRMSEFIYHNSKIVESNEKGRDEYRLYIRNTFDDGSLFLSPDDIVLVFQNNPGQEYILYHFKPGTEMYDELSILIQKYKHGKSLAVLVPLAAMIYEGVLLDKIEDEIMNQLNPEDAVEALKIPVIEVDKKCDPSQNLINELLGLNLKDETPESIEQKVKKIKRDKNFKKIVNNSYNSQCAILGKAITYGKYTSVQACHIIGKEYGGSDNPTNGICLDRNLHWAFDLGMFTINKDYIIEVHPEAVTNELLASINRKKINLPSDTRFYPSIQALEYHKNNIFGLFLK